MKPPAAEDLAKRVLTNRSLTERVLDELIHLGVQEVIVCPGARNAEFINAISKRSEFSALYHFEERSAGFFALGRIQATHKPVAVITTSGTAAGELLPAAMEAYYTQLPVVLVTADRPRRFRGSGAPQAAEQKGIFGIYAPTALDLEGNEPVELTPLDSRPIHLNVCLEDPRGTNQKQSPAPHPDLNSFLQEVQNPLVVVSKLSPTERPIVEAFLQTLRATTYLEATSGLRSSKTLLDQTVRVADRVFERAIHAGAPFDGVLRIGGIPTHRLWRDLEDSRANLPVFNVSSVPLSGLGRPSGVSFGSLSNLLPQNPDPINVLSSLVKTDRELYGRLISLLEQEPTSELGALKSLSDHLPAHTHLFLGNSLPIREWDLVSNWENSTEVTASRGLNGIDGQLSTFLGLCLPNQQNWAILGDLTTLYDLAGPWPLSQLNPTIIATLVIINNSGGRIFERMFPNPAFLNQHQLSFAKWAAFWNLEYQLVTTPSEITPHTQGLKIIELQPDPASTARFWQAFGDLTA